MADSDSPVVRPSRHSCRTLCHVAPGFLKLFSMGNEARQRWMTVMGSTFCPHFFCKTWLPHLKQGLRPDLGYSTVQSRRQSDFSQPVPTAFPLGSSHGCLDFTCEAGGQRHWCSLGAINICVCTVYTLYIKFISIIYRTIESFQCSLQVFIRKLPIPEDRENHTGFPVSASFLDCTLCCALAKRTLVSTVWESRD